jgi:hypothetical protein
MHFAKLAFGSSVAPLGEGRGLAAHGAVVIDQLPHHAILDKEAPAGLGDAQARIAGGEAVAGDFIEQFLAILAVDRLGRKARGQRNDLVPAIFEAGLRRLVGIDEEGSGSVLWASTGWRASS